MVIRSSNGGYSCWRCEGFARGGQAKITPAWKDRPFAVSTPRGLKINALHPGHGLVMNIHLSDVGPHAISLSHSGAVVSPVECMAARALQSDARPAPFHAPQAPAVVPMGAAGFGALMGKLPYDAGPIAPIRAVGPGPRA
jgi:hypothetical protein